MDIDINFSKILFDLHVKQNSCQETTNTLCSHVSRW